MTSLDRTIEALKDAAQVLPCFNDEMVHLNDAIAIVRNGGNKQNAVVCKVEEVLNNKRFINRATAYAHGECNLREVAEAAIASYRGGAAGQLDMDNPSRSHRRAVALEAFIGLLETPSTGDVGKDLDVILDAYEGRGERRTENGTGAQETGAARTYSYESDGGVHGDDYAEAAVAALGDINVGQPDQGIEPSVFPIGYGNPCTCTPISKCPECQSNSSVMGADKAVKNSTEQEEFGTGPEAADLEPKCDQPAPARCEIWDVLDLMPQTVDGSEDPWHWFYDNRKVIKEALENYASRKPVSDEDAELVTRLNNVMCEYGKLDSMECRWALGLINRYAGGARCQDVTSKEEGSIPLPPAPNHQPDDSTAWCIGECSQCGKVHRSDISCDQTTSLRDSLGEAAYASLFPRTASGDCKQAFEQWFCRRTSLTLPIGWELDKDECWMGWKAAWNARPMRESERERRWGETIDWHFTDGTPFKMTPAEGFRFRQEGGVLIHEPISDKDDTRRGSDEQ